MLSTIVTMFRLMWLAADTTALKIKFMASLVCGALFGMITFASPLVLAQLVKNVSEQKYAAILPCFYGLVFLAVALIISRFIWRYVMGVLEVTLPLTLKKIYYIKIFYKPYEWHLNNSVGYFLAAINQVSRLLHSWLWKLPYDYIAHAVLALSFIIYTYTVSFSLFIYFLATLFLMVVMIRLLYIRRISLVKIHSQAKVSFGRIFTDFLYNIRSVKKMNLLAFVSKNLDTQMNDAIKKGKRVMHYNAFQRGLMEVFIQVQFLLPVGYYAYKLIKTGEGIEVIVMLAGIQGRIAELGRLLMAFMYDVADARSDCQILAEHLGDDEQDKKVGHSKKQWQTITFDKTFFEFPKSGSLFKHQVDYFEIHRGDHIAVTGKSGEGKSTFLNLLTKQYPVQGGKIMLDNQNYNQLPAAFFDKTITYISQDVELFDMSFYDNIVMGKKISSAALQKVLDGCCLNELIEKMNGNLQTSIGEKGIKVSGGEKQRINLARGLLLGRDILVLDEITANLDPETSHHIWDFIFKEYADKTIIAISHEDGLLEHINRRLHFKKGRGAEVKTKPTG